MAGNIFEWLGNMVRTGLQNITLFRKQKIKIFIIIAVSNNDV